jgi:hypothetical protein
LTYLVASTDLPDSSGSQAFADIIRADVKQVLVGKATPTQRWKWWAL